MPPGMPIRHHVGVRIVIIHRIVAGIPGNGIRRDRLLPGSGSGGRELSSTADYPEACDLNQLCPAVDEILVTGRLVVVPRVVGSR